MRARICSEIEQTQALTFVRLGLLAARDRALQVKDGHGFEPFERGQDFRGRRHLTFALGATKVPGACATFKRDTVVDRLLECRA